MNHDHDFRRLQEYVDGTASKEDVERLNSRLRHDAGARRDLMELLNLDSALAAISESGEYEAAAEPATETEIQRPPARRFATAAVAVACAAMVLFSCGLWWHSSSHVWATVQNGIGVTELQSGTALRAETHQIAAGIIQLVTSRGVHIVIEAPAEFRFETAQRLKITRGRLSAEVPPAAKGFTVVTPSGDVVDLGTRFGVDVPSAGAAEIHVFQGEVIAKASGARFSENLRGGDAVWMEQGASTARELRSSAFIQADEFSELNAGLQSGQRKRSDAAMERIRQDPLLIALLDFESDETQQGVFRMTQGRWPGSRAPEFVHIGDHMQLDVGGNHDWPQLTLAAWVRLDRLGAPYQSLLHTDGWSQSNPGQVHWMVTQQTTMRLALIGNTLAPGSDERHGFPDSRTAVLPDQGRWVHLAAVYDSTAGTVRFYLNGDFDKETHQAIAHPARLGPAQIGNWNRQDRKLSGRIDELLLLGRAMNDEEVRSLYEAGNPYR